MEVVPKRTSVKVERRMESSPCVSVEEVEKIGNEKKIAEGSFKSSSPNRKDSSTTNQVSTAIASERSSTGTSSRLSPSNPKESDTAINLQEEQLESTKAEMGEVREENERLKALLAKIVKDYQSLQMHFFDIVQQEQAKKPSEPPPPPPPPPASIYTEEPELVSLSLGTSSSLHKKEEKVTSKRKSTEQIEEGLTLGLTNSPNEPVSSNMSPSNSVDNDQGKEEEPGEPWPPSKILKSLRNGADVKEGLQQAHVKKTRVSVRARCDAPTMHDGCQWRKYGQKIAKGNPCPRAYYRCTVAPACPVRKQVQRCAEDMSILITTYEGTHNHPLPISATAMASTTSAAANMLMSGSSTSRSSHIGSPPSSVGASSLSSSTPNLHALNFNLSDSNSRNRPFYLPNPTISSTPSYPTITLDLTSPPQTTSQLPSQFNTRFSPSNFSASVPRYSTSLNFSSSLESSTSWSTNGSYLSYVDQNPYSKIPNIGYQSYLQQKVGAPKQQVLTDTIAKAITSDPSFQSALAAAITSYVGGSGTRDNVNGCGPGSNPQQGSLAFTHPTLGLSSGSKSASGSPVENRENIK